MKYETFKFLWPPRAEQACPPAYLPQCETMGWVAQIKANGTNCTLYVAPDRSTIQRNRHGDTPIVRWSPGENWHTFAKALPGTGWHVFSAELLHLRGNERDTLYVYDLLVCDGEYLVGVDFSSRQSMLDQLCDGHPTYPGWQPNRGSALSHWEFGPRLWRARNHTAGFRDLFDNCPGAFVEGVVVKDSRATLRLCSTPTSNAGWQVKARRPTDHLSF